MAFMMSNALYQGDVFFSFSGELELRITPHIMPDFKSLESYKWVHPASMALNGKNADHMITLEKKICNDCLMTVQVSFVR